MLWEGYLVIGCNQRSWEWDFRAAERSFQKALDLNPGSPAAHRWYANLLTGLARHEEALTHIERAVSLDPLSSDLQVRRATTLLYAHKIDEALGAYESVVHSDPGYDNVYAPMSDALELKGRRSDAIAAAEKAVALTHRASYAVSTLGWLYARASRTGEASSLLDELLRRYGSDEAFATDIAYVYLGLAIKDKAFEWLERGVPRRDSNLLLLKVGIQYEILRSDTRYLALMRRVGF
jgi:tetratricopeptide (TPR) repeat protein